MLSVEQRKTQELFMRRAGMVNVAFIAGIARNIKGRTGYIQRDNNLNHMVPFFVDGTDNIPTWVEDGVKVKIIARVLGDMQDGEPVAKLRVLYFERPSIKDMPPRTAWDRELRPGVPTDAVRPDAYRPDDEPTIEGIRMREDMGNLVRIAGFLSGYVYEPAGQVKADGTVTHGCLILTIRQTADENDKIPVRIYNPAKGAPLAEVNHNHLKRLKGNGIGAPLFVEGQFIVRVKNIADAPEVDGVKQVKKRPYIRLGSQMLQWADKPDIAQEPDWARAMAMEARSERQAAAAKRGSTGITTAVAHAASDEVSTSSPAGAVAPVAEEPTTLDSDIKIDPKALQAVRQ